MLRPKGKLKPYTFPVLGPQGPQGIAGVQGQQGIPGTIPAHKWVGDSIVFQNPDGTWGKPRNIKGASGGGSPDQYKYTLIEEANYTVYAKYTVKGMNIFGVNYAGAVTITLPESLPLDRTIIFNDESGSADSNNITIQTV